MYEHPEKGLGKRPPQLPGRALRVILFENRSTCWLRFVKSFRQEPFAKVLTSSRGPSEKFAERITNATRFTGAALSDTGTKQPRVPNPALQLWRSVPRDPKRLRLGARQDGPHPACLFVPALPGNTLKGL